MTPLDERIARKRQQIAVEAEQEQEQEHKNRRAKLENELEDLLKRREDQRDAVISADVRDRLEHDPEELARLQNRLDARPLTDEQRARFGLPPKDTHGAKSLPTKSARTTAGDTTTKSAEPNAAPTVATERQIKFVQDLIAKDPDAAQKIGIHAESLRTLSRKKASWAIRRLRREPLPNADASN